MPYKNDKFENVDRKVNFASSMSNNIFPFATLMVNKYVHSPHFKNILKSRVSTYFDHKSEGQQISWVISVQNFRFIKLFLTEKFEINWNYLSSFVKYVPFLKFLE